MKAKWFNVISFFIMSAGNIVLWIKDGFSWLNCISTVLCVTAFAMNLALLLKESK